MTPSLTEWTREMKVVLYTCGVLTELQKAGLLSGNIAVTTIKGIAFFDQLDASEFHPSDSEIRKALAAVFRCDQATVNDDVVFLISRWKKAVKYNEGA